MRYLDVTLVAQILSLSAFLTTSAVGQKLEPKFGPAVAYAEGVGPDSVSAADLRGNGVLDLVVANFCEIIGEAGNCEGGVSVLLGNGNGTFQAPVTYGTGAYQATSVAIGDVNGDGIPDLIVANTCGTLGQYGCDSQPGAVSVLLGKGDGTFQSAVVFSSGGLDSYSVAVADLRGDGTLDLVVTNTCLNAECTNGSIGVLLGNGDGTFQPAVSYDSGGYIAASVAIGDVSSDGIPDLLVANFCEYNECGTRNGEVGVLLGNGDGTFKPAVLYDSGGEFLVSVAVGDLRGNGILDVVAANEFSDDEGKKLRSDVGVLLGNGDGTFQTADSYPVDGISYPSYPAIGWGINAIVTADVNGDGIPDVAIVESCQTIQRYTDCVGNKEVNVYLGNGDGTFQAPIVYSSGGFIGLDLAIADVNGDGRPDLVVTNAAVSEEDDSQGSVAVLLNDTTYTTKTALTSSPDPAAINQTVTFTATITSTPSVPNGEVVTFYDGKTELGTGTTTNGVATLSTSFAKEKTYTVKASYPGDAFRKASSGTVKQVVNP